MEKLFLTSLLALAVWTVNAQSSTTDAGGWQNITSYDEIIGRWEGSITVTTEPEGDVPALSSDITMLLDFEQYSIDSISVTLNCKMDFDKFFVKFSEPTMKAQSVQEQEYELWKMRWNIINASAFSFEPFLTQDKMQVMIGPYYIKLSGISFVKNPPDTIWINADKSQIIMNKALLNLSGVEEMILLEGMILYRQPSPTISGTEEKTATTDPGVIINGVRWATRNVDVPGIFADKTESVGKLYQWNRKVAWNATDETVEGWDDTMPEGTEWEKANDPSPAGWRVPTFSEIKSLFDEEKVSYTQAIRHGVTGMKFTDRTTGASIFLPAAGNRSGEDGTLYTESVASYWSSTQDGYDSSFACDFGVGRDSWGYRKLGGFRDCGQSVRPVAE